jgi:hypothetical protein
MVRSEAFTVRFTPNWKDKALLIWCLSNVVAGIFNAGWWYLI